MLPVIHGEWEARDIVTFFHLFSYLQQLKHLPPRSAKMPNEGRAFLLTSQSSRQRAVHSVVSELW
jgi:hypothetical protein